MTVPSLPAQGAPTWYAYAQALDAAVRAGVDPVAVDALVASLVRSDTSVRAAVSEVIPATDTLIPLVEKGAANGVATLGADSKVPTAQLPSIALSDFLGVVASQAAMLALAGQRGDWATRSDLGTDFILIADDPTLLASWRQITSPGGVTSVAGRNGAIALAANDITDATTVGKSVLTAASAAAVRTAITAAALVHAHDVSEINATGTRDATTVLHGDAVWRPPAGGGGGGAGVYNAVKWDSATSSWPARPAVPSSVPVFWMSARYPTAGVPPGALVDDVWYPHLDELA